VFLKLEFWNSFDTQLHIILGLVPNLSPSLKISTRSGNFGLFTRFPSTNLFEHYMSISFKYSKSIFKNTLGCCIIFTVLLGNICLKTTKISVELRLLYNNRHITFNLLSGILFVYPQNVK
jgi:hypothetical protein